MPFRIDQQPIRTDIQNVRIPPSPSKLCRHRSHQRRGIGSAGDGMDRTIGINSNQRVAHVLGQLCRTVGSDIEVICRRGHVRDHSRRTSRCCVRQGDGKLAEEALVRAAEEKV